MLVDITGKPSRAAREGMLFKGRWGPGRERHRQRTDRLTYVLFKGEKMFYIQKKTWLSPSWKRVTQAAVLFSEDWMAHIPSLS